MIVKNINKNVIQSNDKRIHLIDATDFILDFNENENVYENENENENVNKNVNENDETLMS